MGGGDRDGKEMKKLFAHINPNVDAIIYVAFVILQLLKVSFAA